MCVCDGVLLFQLGAESGIDNPNLRAMKTVFRIMPFIILPMTINFPTVSFPHSLITCIFSLSESLLFLLSNVQAVFTYWLTSNVFSLGQVALLRLPSVREKFRIPERIKHPASILPQNDGFIQSMKKGEFLNVGSQYLLLSLLNL